MTSQENYLKLLLTVYEDKATKKVYVEETPLNQKGDPCASKPLSVEVATALGKSLYEGQVKLLRGFIPAQIRPVVRKWIRRCRRGDVFTKLYVDKYPLRSKRANNIIGIIIATAKFCDNPKLQRKIRRKYFR